MAHRTGRFRASTNHRQEGFTLIEVMISMAVMTIGLVNLVAVMGIAMGATQSSQQLAISKKLANEALESILTARETAQIPFSDIQNTGSGGIFLSGPQPIDLPGADGIIGTADDAAAGPQILDMPGPTGVFMNSCPAGPDICLSLANYTRTIAITPYTFAGVPDANLNIVTITITYIPPQFTSVPQNYVLQTLISQYR
jgi:prepilin-type N-terminal cleavage/methylation domain-containing protein